MAFEKKEVRDIKVTVRFTKKEKEIIDSYIEWANEKEPNFKSISDFIRHLLKENIPCDEWNN